MFRVNTEENTTRSRIFPSPTSTAARQQSGNHHSEWQERLQRPTLGRNLTPLPPVKLIPCHTTTWLCAHSQQGLQETKPAKTCSLLLYTLQRVLFYTSHRTNR
jgi:hypothetical protein